MNATDQTSSSGASVQEVLAGFLKGFDLPKFFEALPTAEFTQMLEQHQELIAHKEAEIEQAEQALARLRNETEMIARALAVREELIHAREREKAQKAETQKSAVPPLSPKAKRAAVLRVVESHPGELLSPEDVRRHLIQAGLLGPEGEETGTPVRIILAQMTEGGVLERPEPSKYRLKTRDERVKDAVSDLAGGVALGVAGASLGALAAHALGDLAK